MKQPPTSRPHADAASALLLQRPSDARWCAEQLLPDHAPEYSYQPIYTCYLQYPGKVSLPFPMLGLAEGLVQWVFDRGALTGERGRLACVISAQGAHQQMTHEELADTAHENLHARSPLCLRRSGHNHRREAGDHHLHSGNKETFSRDSSSRRVPRRRLRRSGIPSDAGSRSSQRRARRVKSYRASQR